MGDDLDADELGDELELDDDSVEVELDESDAADEAPATRSEPSAKSTARATTPPPVNEWEEEDRTMLSGSHNEWDGEERTVLHGSEMANVLEEEDAVPGPPARASAPARVFVDEDDSDSVGEVSDEDVEDSGTGQVGAAAVRILGVGKAEPVASRRKRPQGEDADDEPGTEEGVVAATGGEEGDDWGAGLAGASGGLSLLGKHKSDADLPNIPKLTEEESEEVGGAAADGAVIDLDGGSLQAVEEVDPAQLRSFQRAAEEAVSKGDMHQAILHYRDMLDLAPDNLDAYLGRGRCLVHLGDYAAAMSDFQRSEDLESEVAAPARRDGQPLLRAEGVPPCHPVLRHGSRARRQERVGLVLPRHLPPLPEEAQGSVPGSPEGVLARSGDPEHPALRPDGRQGHGEVDRRCVGCFALGGTNRVRRFAADSLGNAKDTRPVGILGIVGNRNAPCTFPPAFDGL